jgi:hypothetical protein
MRAGKKKQRTFRNLQQALLARYPVQSLSISRHVPQDIPEDYKGSIAASLLPVCLGYAVVNYDSLEQTHQIDKREMDRYETNSKIKGFFMGGKLVGLWILVDYQGSSYTVQQSPAANDPPPHARDHELFAGSKSLFV